MQCYLKVIIGCVVAIVVAVVITCAVVFTRSSDDDNSCTLTGTSLDNLNSIMANCMDIVVRDLTVPAGRCLSLTNLTAGTKITFQGTISFGYAEWDGHLITVSGNNITVVGEPGNLINCNGVRWWDGLGGNGGKLKPKVFEAFNLYNSTVTGLNVKNSPKHCFTIQFSEDVVLSDITLDDLDGDSQGGHNTDAFDLNNSNNIYIINSHVVNQDDCMAVNSGSNYHFYNNYCSGGHGISIGSVGTRPNNVVDNIHVRNCTIVNSENGVRIKTIYNATGEVKNIVYEDIRLENIAIFGIVVRGDYRNGGPTGIPSEGVPITNLTLRNIRGTVQEEGVNIYVLLSDGVASNWDWSSIDVTGSRNDTLECAGLPTNLQTVC